MYFNADEIISRLEKRAEYQKTLLNAKEKATVVAKKATKRTKVVDNS